MDQRAELLSRYQHLRRVALALNNRLTATLPRSVIEEGGQKLGILKQKVITLDTEDTVVVLMDFCLHDVRDQGVNAIERYLANTPPAADSDEMVLLQSMRQARFSLFAVESTEPGVGVHLRDLLRKESLFIVDVGFSHSATVGLVLAARVVAPDGIAMTTGAALPIGVLTAAVRAQFLQGLNSLFEGDFRQLSPERVSDLAATIIRTCLQQGAAEHIRYIEPKGASGGGRLPTAATPARRVGRNDPCPCGSGQKFKRCCGRQR